MERNDAEGAMMMTVMAMEVMRLLLVVGRSCLGFIGGFRDREKVGSVEEAVTFPDSPGGADVSC